MSLALERRLTVKLRGRAEAPDGAEGAQSLSARGAKPQAHHGPLQRLLEDLTRALISAYFQRCPSRRSCLHKDPIAH
jgi:hypothetical protein